MNAENQPILVLKDLSVAANQATPEQNLILKQLNLTINAGDFVSVLGTNGAGKSTLFNAIAGNLPIPTGELRLNGHLLNSLSAEKRSRYIARVFQDPKLGTAPRMTVAENLLLALHRGQRRTLKPRGLKQQRANFQRLLATMGNGLAEHLDTPAENLSGGQRQALSFLMATERQPDLLLLDEHTAALDPKTSDQLMAQTNQVVTEQQLTCLMITHHLEDALKYGNRLIILSTGQILLDVSGTEKAALTKTDILAYFGQLASVEN
ncbi:ABC transporter ATP-binding protein [Lapidilactobacillus bayanensis]|uniref:ABC transporter ATP-binding protein n=1 Tax=Lapidilactobacillus bayanensis TaxID=2485998 RepID=UPI000F7728D2|nr:ATP-binding cassette domain-containing protein [Lapidilactobacillus bayanensis]